MFTIFLIEVNKEFLIQMENFRESLIDSGVDVFIGLQLYEQKLIIIKMKLRMRLVNTVHLALLLPILYSISFFISKNGTKLK